MNENNTIDLDKEVTQEESYKGLLDTSMITEEGKKIASHIIEKFIESNNLQNVNPAILKSLIVKEFGLKEKETVNFRQTYFFSKFSKFITRMGVSLAGHIEKEDKKIPIINMTVAVDELDLMVKEVINEEVEKKLEELKTNK